MPRHHYVTVYGVGGEETAGEQCSEMGHRRREDDTGDRGGQRGEVDRGERGRGAGGEGGGEEGDIRVCVGER